MQKWALVTLIAYAILVAASDLNPLSSDTDSNGMSDSWELHCGFDPILFVKTEDYEACMCQGANLDRVEPVNFADFVIFAQDWQNSCGTVERCGERDINQSGTVDFDDLAILSGHWLSSCSQ